VHMDVAIEITTAATPTDADIADTTMFEPIEKIENWKWGRRREALATPSDWRSCIERIMRQQAQQLTQLHQTVGHRTNLVQAQTAHEGAQWLGMTTWMQEKEPKWDACHKDNKVSRAGITNVIPKIMKGVAPG